MPSVKIHCAISKKRTGNSFSKLHKWIDEPVKIKGVNHREERHYWNEKDRSFILKEFKKKAVVEWLFHIAIDNLDTAVKEAKRVYRKDNVFNHFEIGFPRKSKFIHFDCCNMRDDELIYLFEDDEEDDY